MPTFASDKIKLTIGLHCANLNLKLDELAQDFYCAGAIIDEITGEKMEYRDLIKRPTLRDTWHKSLANEVGCLTQCICNVEGTTTLFFIPQSKILMHRGKEITYGRIVVAYKPDKLKNNIVCLTVGGNLIHYPFDKSTLTLNLPTFKLLWNSGLPSLGARYFTMDRSSFYLRSPLPRPEYICLLIKITPDEIVEQ